MMFSVSVVRGVLVALAALVLSGCVPSAQSQLDEEKEPHFLAGKNRVHQLDYKGAIDCFEKALEANPQSASAHFELACLYEQREADSAAAIYHYDRYLKLRPQAENAEIVKQHIVACKQELARTVSLGPVTEKVQHELEQLVTENKRLHEDLEKWRAYATQLQALTNPPPAPAPPPGRQTPVSASGLDTSLAGTSSHSAAVGSASLRTHTIKPGETPSLIARQYGIKLEALLAANPKVNPRRIKAGQTLNIPAP